MIRQRPLDLEILSSPQQCSKKHLQRIGLLLLQFEANCYIEHRRICSCDPRSFISRSQEIRSGLQSTHLDDMSIQNHPSERCIRQPVRERQELKEHRACWPSLHVWRSASIQGLTASSVQSHNQHYPIKPYQAVLATRS